MSVAFRSAKGRRSQSNAPSSSSGWLVLFRPFAERKATETTYSSHPLRYSRRMSAAASGEFFTLSAAPSHSIWFDSTGSKNRAMSQNNLRAGVWRLADPKISLASFAGMAMAAMFAAADGALAPGWLALTVLGVFCIEVGKNASGEVVDFDSGTDQAVAREDRSPFSGGKRVLVDGLLTRQQCWTIAAVFFATGIVIGDGEDTGAQGM